MDWDEWDHEHQSVCTASNSSHTSVGMQTDAETPERAGGYRIVGGQADMDAQALPEHSTPEPN